MAGLEDLISKYPALASIANAIGMKKEVVEPAELPALQTIDMNRREVLDKNPFYSLPKSTIPTDLPTSITAYRADPANKYGGNDGLETRPISRLLTGGNYVGKKPMYEPDKNPETSTVLTDPNKATQEVYRRARLLGAANKYGYATMTPEDAAAFVLKEGRSDMGHGGVQLGNKKDREFDKMLGDTYNLHSTDKNFLAALYSKQRVAEKLGISLPEAWNGTGVNDAGQSGKQYASNWQAHKEAATNPKNAELLKLIQRAMDDGRKFGLPLKSNAEQDARPKRKKVSYKTGGMVDKPLVGGSKLI